MIATGGASDKLDKVPKGSDPIEIVKEDILRMLCERSKKTSLEVIKDEVKVAHLILSKAIEELQGDDLIAIQEGMISLTKAGQENAEIILKKHFVLEDYFEKIGSKIEAHIAAHILEHYVSGEVVNNIKKLSTLGREGIPLTKFQLEKEGMISNIMFFDYGLFERIISMGIFLGEKIVVTNEVPHGIIVKINNKKFALDKKIAKEIMAVEYEKT